MTNNLPPIPDWGDWGLAVVTALLGGGGAAAFFRSRGQNKADLLNAMTAAQVAFAKEQSEYRASISADLAAIRQREVEQDNREQAQERRNQELSAALAERTREIGGLQAQISSSVERIRELETMYRQLLEEKGRLSARLEQIEIERASAVQRLQTEMATRQFLERENNEIRKENDRLRSNLPAREEVKPGLREKQE
jgi:chromosome segregation ATPase